MENRNVHITLICLTLIASLFSSCDKESAPDCFQKAGESTTIIRELDERIRKIEITDMIDLEIYQSDENYLEITGPENLLPELITEVTNGDELKIRNDNTCNFVRSFRVNYTVRVYSDVEEILNLGEGKVSSVNVIERDYFRLENEQASGDINLEFNCDSVSVLMHNGSSGITLRGTSNKTYLFHNGINTFDASELQSTTTLINQSSINEMHFSASEYLFVYIGSRGNAYYQGGPNTIEFSIEGTGQLIEE